MSKQIKFVDLENNTTHGGILLDNGDVICGCCGGLFEKAEEGETWNAVEIYDAWMNIDKAIIEGDWNE